MQVLVHERRGLPSRRHEFATEAHEPGAFEAHVSVRVQHVPTTPLAGAGPGCPVRFPTHSWFAPQATVTVPPQPFGRFVPHCPWPENEAAVFGVQHAPGVPAAGAGVAPPFCVQVWPPAHGQFSVLCPQPFARLVPHWPG